MPIVRTYAPNANLVGDAAYTAGLGEYLQRQQQFAEQQRQFDSRQGLADQQLKFEQQLRNRQMGEQQRQFDLQLFDRGQQRAAGLIDQQMRNQAYAQGEYLQQAGQNQRQQNQYANQFQMLQYEQLGKQHAADAQMVNEFARKGASPQEYQDAVDAFNAKYAQSGMGQLVELPPPQKPDWQNPEAMLNQARQLNPTAPWYIDPETQTPALPRGWNYQMDPTFQSQQHQMEMERAQQDADAKLALEREKAQLDPTVEEKHRKEERDFQLKIIDDNFKTEMDILKAIQPDRKNYETPSYNAEGKAAGVTFNEGGYRKAMNEWMGEVRKLQGDYTNQRRQFGMQEAGGGGQPAEQPAPVQEQPSPAPIWDTIPHEMPENPQPGDMWMETPVTATLGVPVVYKKVLGQGILSYIGVRTTEDVARLPSGTRVITPDGRTATVK